MLLATDLYFEDSAIDRIGQRSFDYLHLTFLSASLQLNPEVNTLPALTKGESYTGRSMTELILNDVFTALYLRQTTRAALLQVSKSA